MRTEEPAPDSAAPPGAEGTSPSAEGTASTEPRRRRLGRRLGCAGLVLLAIGAALGLAAWELKTSALQARFVSAYAERLWWRVLPGPSDAIVFPPGGPFDLRRGYSQVPDFVSRSEARGFRVARQARFSSELLAVAEHGLNLPYRPAPAAGLVLRDREGRTFYDAMPDRFLYRSFGEVPPLVVRSLLFIENRELAVADDPRKNPAVEWDRFARAAFLELGSRAGLDWRVEGGSTLAVQIEKYRHAPGGRTASGADKLRQIASATLKAYREGPDTRERRREIVLDYLNTMPLGAAPGFGELTGLGEGLYAWFDSDLAELSARLERPDDSTEKAIAVQQVLALVAAVKAPTHYLVRDRSALAARIASYLDLLVAEGVLSTRLASGVRSTPLLLRDGAPVAPPGSFVARKGTNLVRLRLRELLGVTDLYSLDQLHLEAAVSIDEELQGAVRELFGRLRDPQQIVELGLRQDRLLASGDPGQVLYSMALYERTAAGNRVLVHTDTLEQPFDLNAQMKLELGSTGKLRTLVHYLELVAELHADLATLPPEELAARMREAQDPLTEWAIGRSRARPTLPELLEAALDRRYSASTGETFFTGGGLHRFANFDRNDEGTTPSVREATWRSVNLLYVRLMRDLVRYHAARLPYDARRVLTDPSDEDRQRLLAEEADAEARSDLLRAWRELRGKEGRELERALLGSRADSPRALAVLYYAWGRNEGEDGLAHWLGERLGPLPESEVRRLAKAVGGPRLGLADHGFLVGQNPLRLWAAGRIAEQPDISWRELLAESEEAREVASAWLFRTRNRSAQDRRLRTRIEKDAFARMEPAWKRLGYPFDHLVPSYATALGASGDRPVGLAELMGILLDDGIRRPPRLIERLDFASNTPYETSLEAEPVEGERVLAPEVAAAVRDVLVGVVEQGTARRLAGGTIHGPDGTPLPIGGKTGSGDNRIKSFARGGAVTGSRAVSRTASFTFFVGDRYYGVINAYVPGEEADSYRFTSALPVTVLKLLAPELERRLRESEGVPGLDGEARSRS